VTITDQSLAWAESVVGPLRATPIAAGTTGIVLRLDAAGGECVLKLYCPDPEEPDCAWREQRILDLLRETVMPVPRVLAIDRDGSSAGWPAVLMTRVAGRKRIRPRETGPWLKELASLAARIHALPFDSELLPRYRLWGLNDPLEKPRWWRDAGAWRAAVELFRGPMPQENRCFIHRDFHPGNVLWQGGHVSGVVDWLHGCWGPPSADLGHCRLNLWLDNGPAAARQFLDLYGASDYDHYWDIADAMTWHVDPKRDGERHARRWESFITAAIKSA
jgi:aminoglycoside phosphotransferase (APT) family kinase protein